MIVGKPADVASASEREQVTEAPADGVPQLQPEALLTLGDARLCGTEMVTDVVTALEAADPALLTVVTMVPVEPVVQLAGVMATLRSAPFTMAMVAVAESSNELTSFELEMDP